MLDSNMFTNPLVYTLLNNMGAVKMRQMSAMHPCKDTLSVTRGGDIIPTPEFWRIFTVYLDSSNAKSCIEYLMLFHANN